MTALRVPRSVAAEIVAHALEDRPNECCGILAAKDGEAVKLFRATNSEASPVRYGLDPHEQYAIMKEIDDRDWNLGAIYHSHTRSPAYPSQTDVNLAFYPEALYVIVSLEDPDRPDLRAFRIVGGTVEEAGLSIA